MTRSRIFTRTLGPWLRLAAMAAFGFGLGGYALAGNLIYDEFNYPAGNLVGAPGSTWTHAANGAALAVGGASLSFTGLPRQDNGNHSVTLTTDGTNDGEMGKILLSSQVSPGDIYMSFLLNVSSPPPIGPPADTSVLLAFHETSGTNNHRGAVNIFSSTNPGKYMIGVTHYSFAIADQAAVELSVGQTYLIVIHEARVGTGSDNNDTCKLYVDPAPLITEPAAATATYVTATDTDWPDTAKVDAIFMEQQHYSGAFTAQVDALRAGTTWSDVVPPVYNLMYEEFNYGAGNLIGATGSAWTQSSAAGSSGVPLVVGNTSLAYPGLLRNDTANHSVTLQTNGTSTGGEQEGKMNLSAPIAGPDAYLSFLLNITSPPPTGVNNDSTLIAFHESDGATFFRGAVNLIPGTTAGTYRLGVTHFNTSAATMTSTTLNANQTYLVVVHEHRTDAVASNKNDVAEMYINPSPLGTEPATPTVTYIAGVQGATDTDWPTTATLDGVFLRARRFAGAFTGQIDAIRAGTTWEQAINGSPAPSIIDPKLSTASSLVLGPIPASATATTPTLLLTNVGPALPLHIQSDSAITGAGASHFLILPGQLPLTIGPNNSTHTLSLAFEPQGVYGLTTATLLLHTDGKDTTQTAIALSGNAVHSLPLYEPFNDAPGAKLTTNSNHLWSAFTSAGVSSIPVLDTLGDSSKSLTYAGMPAPQGRRISVQGVGSGTGESVKELFANAVSSGNIYFSMLLKVTTDTLETTGSQNSAIIAGFNRHPALGSDSTQVNLRITSTIPNTKTGPFDLGLSLSSFANVDIDFTPTDLQAGQTYFLVLKYTFGSGNDTATLWINPTWASGAEGAGAVQTLVHPARGADATMAATDVINGIALQQQRFAGHYKAEVDEIRVGTNYSDVTDATVPVEPINAAGGWTLFN